MIENTTDGMIKLLQEVEIMSSKIAISLPENLLMTLDQLAKKWNTTRSGAVARLIKQAEEKELEAQLREGYLELAEINRREAEFFFPAQYEVVQKNGD